MNNFTLDQRAQPIIQHSWKSRSDDRWPRRRRGVCRRSGAHLEKEATKVGRERLDTPSGKGQEREVVHQTRSRRVYIRTLVGADPGGGFSTKFDETEEDDGKS